MQKLNATAFGLAMGIVWMVFSAMLVIISMYTGFASAWVEIMSSIYPGTGATWTGLLISLPWTFVDGFIGAFLVIWLYNKFV